MMDCSEVRRFLHAYIDDEFDERERLEFELHLQQCRACRQEVSYYRGLHDKLHLGLEREVAPVRLEAAICYALEKQTEPRWGWFSLSLASAGAFLCALGIFLWSPTIHDQIPRSQPHQMVGTISSTVPSRRFARVRSIHGKASFSRAPLTRTMEQAVMPRKQLAAMSSQTRRCMEPQKPSYSRRKSWLEIDRLCDPPRRYRRHRRPALIRANFTP